MKKRVLITGASGFIGYHLVAEALNNNLEVTALVRKNSNVKQLKQFDIEYLDIDLKDKEELSKVFKEKKFNYIIHAAGITRAKEQQVYDRINADYTYNLAYAAEQCGIEKFLFVSSLAALGPLESYSGKLENNSPKNPVTGYGKSKVLAEEYLQKFKTLPWVAIRPTAVYGPREKDILIVINSVKKRIEPYIGNTPQQLTFIYVKDLVDIIFKALFSNIIHKSYNASDGNTYDRYALANEIKSYYGIKTLKFNIPLTVIKGVVAGLEMLYANSEKAPVLNKEKLNELTALNWSCSIKELQNDLSFSPTYDLRKGIRETLDWQKSNPS